MRPLNNPDLRIYPPPPRDDSPPPDDGSGMALLFVLAILVVIVLSLTTGCGSPSTDAEKAKRTGVGILAESAIAKPRTYAPIRTPALPTFAEPYALPNGDASHAFPAPALESTEQPATRETLNQGPCPGDRCLPQPVRRGFFGRRR